MSELANGTEMLRRHGQWDRVDPQNAGWEFIYFSVERLGAGQSQELAAGEVEYAIVPLAGKVTVEAEGERWELGRRRSVFDGRGECLYLPRDTAFTVTAHTDAEYALCGARCDRRMQAKHVRVEDTPVEARGAGNASRQIGTLIPPEFPADRLLIVEVWTPGGNWSSFPPHKHDVLGDDEAVLEETYYFRTAAPGGFAFQRVYSPERDVDLNWSVADGDLLVIPWGYHTTCAAHGHDLYYLNVLAGPAAERTLQAHIDPALASVRDAWPEMAGDERLPLVAGVGSLS
jgi:5-deoxy-glucuronate isomerase